MRMLVGTLLLFSTGLAHAYVGPGLGIGVLGAILGLLTAIVLAIVGTVWYPIKRMLRARPASAGAEPTPPAALEAAPEGEQESRS